MNLAGSDILDDVCPGLYTFCLERLGGSGQRKQVDAGSRFFHICPGASFPFEQVLCGQGHQWPAGRSGDRFYRFSPYRFQRVWFAPGKNIWTGSVRSKYLPAGGREESVMSG